ncbi:site-2 protease family protein [Candidatus Woesearchaeota archaeon]|jgi:Zn-dependent protease/predicted transcriptional regulator|nr:site-2 protease family protein [Candidatus Woesearchaeota archaeon]MBT4336530.1 site-2 protease family protein [Candidatus Woesearchaeota archaeon]MBT4469721.1 site-2 protease family protein [Candidatus Woesearchaeota archaeon]MBT6744083.1 site-2 protease family protein [Candidatus Woesearchaeota archaeon]
MRGSTKLFRIFGIDIKLHFTWWFVFALLAWSLSASFFPEFFPDLSKEMYWSMGITASLLLFVSVLLHELSHSLVAKAKRIKVESITLFFFGGVAGITREDMKPSSEFQMAIAGPIFSLLLAGVFYLVNQNGFSVFITAISFYLYQLNLILAVFNSIPAFPLDGGRAFRAILYWYFKDLRKATKIAVSIGKFFAGFLIVLGVIGLFNGIGAGLWFVFLGGFLFFIAGASYEQVAMREVLADIRVKELLKKKYAKLSPSMKFVDFVKKYANKDEEVFIVKGKGFVGIIDLKQINKMPVKMQEMIKLKQVSIPLHQIKTLGSKDSAYTAFRKFAETGLEILPVMDGKKVLGVVSKKSVMHRLVWEFKFGKLGKVKKRKHKQK